jgi:hypothetical protein
MIDIRKWIVPLERFVTWMGKAMTALDNVITEGCRLTNIVGLFNRRSLFCVY